MKVHTASQFIDAVQKAVARSLGVRQHSVEVGPACLLAALLAAVRELLGAWR